MFENASWSAGSGVARGPRSGAWVTYGHGDLPDDTTAAGLVDGTGYRDVAGSTDCLSDGTGLADGTGLTDAPGLPDSAGSTDTADTSDAPGVSDGTGASDDAERVDVADVPVGAQLAAVLAGLDAATADGYDLVEAAAGWARLAAWVAARQAVVLTALAARPELRPADTGYRSVNPVTNTAVEVAGRTQLTSRQAENLVGHAVQLAQDFPATLRSLEAGAIDERRAKVITAELGGQDAGVRRRVEAAVLPAAASIDSVALRRRIRQLLLELAPLQTEQRCQQARERRDVTMTPAEDGMAYVDAYLPAEDAVAVTSVLSAAAQTLKRQDAAAGQEPRTAGQRRADALAALAWAALSTQQIGGDPAPVAHRPGCTCTCTFGSLPADVHVCGDDHTGRPRRTDGGHVTPADHDGPSAPQDPVRIPLSSAQGRPVAVNVTFAFRSLVGLDDQPGYLEGYGPIPAAVARHLAAAGVWQWVGTDPATGRVLDHGTTRYRPPQALIDHVVLRDRTCRAPGCHRPAVGCDIDHRSPYRRGGPTSACNCHALCRLHHLLKHDGGWRVHRHVSGATVWTSPTGHAYVKPPEQVGPIPEPSPDPQQADDPPPF
ncbi:HNH endonuclease signature motif containing protein [Jiangella gansuensis]|uniref:HNH endonuclease signature motif containing protein n=1 Tax=Jiangella gansuensis TaxID=281473 RepID=UPI000479AFC6|nr:HNH endonuclease signature motif containing protein [Jiangella gansuensis]